MRTSNKMNIENNMEKLNFIVMVVGDDQRYVLTKDDVERGGFVDATPEDFGNSYLDEAERIVGELKEYVRQKGYDNVKFYIEKQ